MAAIAAPPATTAPSLTATRIGFETPEAIPDKAYALVAAERVIWLGEMHGSNEAPRLFLGLVRLVARSDQPPIVGLEFPDTDQPAIDEFMLTGDPQIVANKTVFRWPGKDGRSSKAMFALLQALRAEKIAAVVCFDTSTATTAQQRDTDMAEHLANAATRFPKAKLVVLSGGVHSRVTAGASWDSSYRPAGCELSRSLPALATFALHYEHGTIWALMGADKSGGEHEIGGWPNEDSSKYWISLSEKPNDGHRGILFSKTLTASFPWKPDLTPSDAAAR